MVAKRRTDDRADEYIIFSRTAQWTGLKGIGKMYENSPVCLHVSLKTDTKAEKITLSRTSTPPRIVLQLSAGPLAMFNVDLIVTDKDIFPRIFFSAYLFNECCTSTQSRYSSSAVICLIAVTDYQINEHTITRDLNASVNLWSLHYTTTVMIR